MQMHRTPDNPPTRPAVAGKFSVVAALLASAFLCTLLCSQLSPIMSIVGVFDQSCFLRAGAAMANGMLPYVDFIDVKGPLLFIIQLAG